MDDRQRELSEYRIRESQIETAKMILSSVEEYMNRKKNI